MKKNLLRWMPAVIAPAAVVAAVTVPTVAGAAPQLPEKTPQELLTLIAESDDAAFSGTVEQTSDLGLPELPSTGSPHGNSGDGAAGTFEMLTQSHRAQVHVGDDKQLRVQVMEEMSQRDVIVNDDEVWLYDSNTDEAKHLKLPEHSKHALAKHPDLSKHASAKLEQAKEHGAGMAGHEMSPGAVTPADLADHFLAKIGPTTDVTVSGTASIAGRSAYELELTPKTDETLIGSITLGVDSETGMPLSFSVTARGDADPAFSAAFTDIDFGAPADSLFEFTPPDSATVTEIPAKPDHGNAGEHHRPSGSGDGAVDHPRSSGDGAGDKPRGPGSGNGSSAHMSEQRPTVIGEGWSSIVSVPVENTELDGAMAGPASGEEGGPGQGQDIMQELTRPVEGGQLLQTSLVSVLITDDGRVLFGAVNAESLMAAAAR